MKYLIPLITIIGFLSTLSCSKMDPEMTLAQIGDEKITYDEFEIFIYQKTKQSNLAAVSDELKNRYFDEYIDLAFLAQMAEDSTSLILDDFKIEFEKKKQIWIAQYFYWDYLVTSLFSPEEIEDFHQNMDVEFRVRHILVGFEGSQNSNLKRSKDEAYHLVNKIYNEALKGEISFSDLARKYSEGPSAQKGGALNPFGKGKMTKAFENSVFELAEGEISKPVETEFGYHVILLEKREQKVMPITIADANEKVRVYQSILSVRNPKIQNLFNYTSDSLKKMINFQYNEENISWLSGKMAKFDEKKTRISSALFSNIEKEKALFSFMDYQYTIADLLDEYGKRIRSMVKRMLTPDGLKRSIDGSARLLVWAYVGEKEGYDKTRWVILQENNFRRVKLGKKYTREILKPQVTYTKKDIEEFYDRNISRYYSPAKIDISIIRQADIEIAAIALKKAKAGEKWEQLVNEYSQGTKFEKERSGNIGFRGENTYQDVSIKAFEYGTDTIVPELVLYGNTFFIVKTGEKRDAFTKPLKDVQKDIIGAVKLRNEYLLVREIVDKQKEKIGFSEYRSVLKL